MRAIVYSFISICVVAALLGAQDKPADKKAPPAPPAKKARKVLTDDDFDSTRNPKAIQEAQAAETAKTAEKAPAEAPPDDIEAELKALRQQLKTTQTMIEKTEAGFEKEKQDAENAPDPVMKDTIRRGIEIQQQLVLEQKAKAEEIQAKIRALEKQKNSPEEGKTEEKPPEKPEAKKP